MNHVMESAAIVAKLIKFSEQAPALKEMFGLSIIPPPRIVNDVLRLEEQYGISTVSFWNCGRKK